MEGTRDREKDEARVTMTEGTAGPQRLHAGEGWHVLHDLSVPGTAAAIDHVVVTPAGVFVVDFEHGDPAAGDRHGGLRASCGARRPAPARLRWEMDAVAEALAGAPISRPAPVRGIIALAGGVTPAGPPRRATAIDTVPLEGIVRFLTTRRRILDPAEVDVVAAHIERRLRARFEAVASPDGAVQVALAS
jgi:hypothetical protein